MTPEKIARINELAKKKRETGLNDAELAEQQVLYKEYLAEIRASFTGTLDNTVIVRPDGTRESVKDNRASAKKK